ncbi:hypothetical protein B484DRAFT_110923 [Ochromonadaceae sp. CCMP2298]|nr:hypothetical protein B484DRAFT_110923 [Ochromonadaceae sp. CCMP2298]
MDLQSLLLHLGIDLSSRIISSIINSRSGSADLDASYGSGRDRGTSGGSNGSGSVSSTEACTITHVGTHVGAITASDLLPKTVRHTLFACISALQSKIPSLLRDRCMNCGDCFPGDPDHRPQPYSLVPSLSLPRLTTNRHHCRMCRRVICLPCSAFLPARALPPFVTAAYLPAAQLGGSDAESPLRVCLVCFDVLLSAEAEADAEVDVGAEVVVEAQAEAEAQAAEVAVVVEM